jgi:outer membrane protein assembly factor BamB
MKVIGAGVVLVIMLAFAVVYYVVGTSRHHVEPTIGKASDHQISRITAKQPPSEWRQQDADETYSGATEAETDHDHQTAWKTLLPISGRTRTNEGTMVAAGGTIYVSPVPGALFAVDASDGRVLWKHDDSADWAGSAKLTHNYHRPYSDYIAATDAGVVHYDATSQTMRLYRASDGSVVWATPDVSIGGDSLTVHGGTLYFISDLDHGRAFEPEPAVATDIVACDRVTHDAARPASALSSVGVIDIGTGEFVRRTFLDASGCGGMLLDPVRVGFFSTGESKMFVQDARSVVIQGDDLQAIRSVRWINLTSGPASASSDGTYYYEEVANGSDNIAAANSDGKKVWTHHIGAKPGFGEIGGYYTAGYGGGAKVIVTRDRVLAVTSAGLLCLRKSDGTTAWTAQIGPSRQQLVMGDSVYCLVGSQTSSLFDTLARYDLKSGAAVSRELIGSEVISMIAHRGAIYAVQSDGGTNACMVVKRSHP